MPKSPGESAAALRPVLPSSLRPTRTRYWVIFFAVTLAIITYVDRVCISQTAKFIRADLNLDEGQMGWAFSAFTLAYALFEIPSGYLADRIGPRKVLLRIVLCWSFFTVATGWVRNWGSLIAVRFLFGAGEAGAFPSLTKAFKRWLPLAERTRAQGIMWMSARLGGALTPFLVLACLNYVTWRGAFLIFGLLGVVWAIVFHLWYRDDPRTHPQVNAAEAAALPAEEEGSDHFAIPWKPMFRSPTMWYLWGQYFTCSYFFLFLITWFPTYLNEKHHFNLKASTMLSCTPFVVGAFGCFFAGWILPLLSRRYGARAARCGVGAVGSLGAACFLVMAALQSNPYYAVAAIVVATFFNDIQMPGAWTACMDIGGKSVATVSSTMNMMGNIGGFLSPIICGHIVKWTHNWNIALYVTAGLYLVGMLCWLALDPVTPLEEQEGKKI